ncbi:MAG: PBP1A family penicillin-binding protein [Candidatus Eisenbacteria bacterium]|nr:PBP1A family penicillin-binding protein [Candidatus Eisenbacteria bacterium]
MAYLEPPAPGGAPDGGDPVPDKWKKWLLVFSVTLAAVVLASVGSILWLSRDLPSPSRLEAIEPTIGTVVYDRNGEVIHEFFRENRVIVGLDDISPYFIDAIIATEDRDFREHWGIDIFGIARAAMSNLRAGRVVQGASTITQQLARSLFLTQEVTLTRKLKEALLALRIEQTYSKDRIIELYLNQIYFGGGAYGVEAAAEDILGKGADQLDLHEAALLAGLPKNPSGYSPRTHPERARERRSLVLSRMVVNGAVSPEEAAAADTASLSIVERDEELKLGAYFIEHVRRQVIAEYGAEALFSGGLRIHTTLDLDMQRVAEQALEERFAALETDYDFPVKRGDEYDLDTLDFIPYVQGALLAVDVRTGGVLAMVGGRDFSDSPFNRATQAPRQPGSGFKPFVYTAAIEARFSPADTIMDAPILIPGAGTPNVLEGTDPPIEEPTDWMPENYSREHHGVIRLRYALKKSINIPAVKLAMLVGPDEVARYAKEMGVERPISSVYSLALGSAEVRLIDMVRAYGVLANQGIRLEPYAVEKIEDRNGKVLEIHSSMSREILPPQTAYVVTSMLESVIESGTGWGARARGFTHPAAGKTGTTNDCTDAWFVGFTPRVICGVWGGYDDRQSLGEKMTGARVALPVWTEFMKAAHANTPKTPFPVPPGIVTRTICEQTGLLASEDCPEVMEEVFVQGTEPVRHCEQHGGGAGGVQASRWSSTRDRENASPAAGVPTSSSTREPRSGRTDE